MEPYKKYPPNIWLSEWIENIGLGEVTDTTVYKPCYISEYTELNYIGELINKIPHRINLPSRWED